MAEIRETSYGSNKIVNKDLIKVTEQMADSQLPSTTEKKVIVINKQPPGAPSPRSGGSSPRDKREVEVTEGEAFSRDNGLIWLGETSLRDDHNNVQDIFLSLLEAVHLT